MTFLDLSHNQIHSISEAAFDENSYAGEVKKHVSKTY